MLNDGDTIRLGRACKHGVLFGARNFLTSLGSEFRVMIRVRTMID